MFLGNFGGSLKGVERMSRSQTEPGSSEGSFWCRSEIPEHPWYAPGSACGARPVRGSPHLQSLLLHRLQCKPNYWKATGVRGGGYE